MGIGVYATALFLVGLHKALGAVAAPENDSAARAADIARALKSKVAKRGAAKKSLVSLGVRRRMNDADAKAREDDENARKGRRPGPVAAIDDSAVQTHIEVTEVAVNDAVIESGGADLVVSLRYRHQCIAAAV